MENSKDILFLPVKPKWADLIMSGKKTLELRKRLPSKGWGKRCVIYSTSPQCEIVGTAYFLDCGRILMSAADVLGAAHVTHAEFDAYFGNGDQNCITLVEPIKFAKPIALETLRCIWGIKPPQQWRYIDETTYNDIVKAGQ